MIDSHCHLADPQFERDLEAVLVRAQEANVKTVITIADSLKEGERCLEIAEKYDHIYCTIGVHPHNAKDWSEGDSDRLKTLLSSSKKVKALGEIGLDFHYNNSPQDVQREVFTTQLMIAKEKNLPAVVHCREAAQDIANIIQDVSYDRFVIHCCTEKWDDVSGFVERGAMLSFTGIATYPKSEDIRNTIKMCPLNQLMIETDAPYLAPNSKRGKRNEPAFVAEVLELVADIKGTSVEEADAQTTKNTVEFFGLPF